MATDPPEFEPLMSSIEKLLRALDTKSPSLQSDIEGLRARYDEYAACCCRRARVVAYGQAQMPGE